jgi:hypothetical protein
MITLTISGNGIPCLWEKGGGYSNSGESTIITGKHGQAKKSIFVREKGVLSCNTHALIPVFNGDYVIEANHSFMDYTIQIYRITAIKGDKAVVKLTNTYSDGSWDAEPCWQLFEAIEVAKKKAAEFHCRRPLWIR